MTPPPTPTRLPGRRLIILNSGVKILRGFSYCRLGGPRRPRVMQESRAQRRRNHHTSVTQIAGTIQRHKAIQGPTSQLGGAFADRAVQQCATGKFPVANAAIYVLIACADNLVVYELLSADVERWVSAVRGLRHSIFLWQAWALPARKHREHCRHFASAAFSITSATSFAWTTREAWLPATSVV